MKEEVMFRHATAEPCDGIELIRREVDGQAHLVVRVVDRGIGADVPIPDVLASLKLASALLAAIATITKGNTDDVAARIKHIASSWNPN